MSMYLFILGREAELSMAELRAVYPQALFSELDKDVFMMESSEKIDQKAFNRLGGVIKMAKIEKTVEENDLDEAILDLLLTEHRSGKLNYGVSLYGPSHRTLGSILIQLKKNLKMAGVSSRFANQNFENLSIPQYKGLKGPEFLVVKQGGEFLIARTLACQDIDAYSKRDYQKPFRSMKVGMLPPKLAQMLINLTGSKGPIWDPFCGGGVLVMEGLLMGYDMLGSDIDQVTLEGAEKNVDWIKNQFNLHAKADLFLHDATDPVPKKSFEAIAFEGYLGPPQTKMKSERELKILISQLDQLYLHFFSALKKARFKGVIVTALPFFKAQQRREISLNCPQKIQELGFELTSLLPTQGSSSLKYARSDQMVGREIFRFRLKI